MSRRRQQSNLAVGICFVLGASLPASAQNHNWTGVYLGGNAGAAGTNASFATSILPGTYLGNIPINLNAINAAGTGTGGGTPKFTGGLQLGYNLQMGSMVFGLEADINGLTDKAVTTGRGLLTTGQAFATENVSKMSGLATLRPRVGFTFDRALIYATGGLAYAQREYTQSYRDILNGAFANTAKTEYRAGAAIGGGLELALTNTWSIKGEYLYLRFNSASITNTIYSTSGAHNALIGTADFTTQIGRVGVSHKF
jgi:outer membrane immunogenic protein